MDRREHRLARHEALAVLRLDARAAAALEHQPAHPPPAQHRGAVVLEEAHERVRERARAAARHAPAALLAAEHERVRQRSGARLVERLKRLPRHPEHERLDVTVLELVPHHVPRAHRVDAQPPAPARQLRQALLERGAEAHRGEAAGAVRALHGVVVREQPAVALGVARREARDLLAGAIEVEPHAHLLAVRERHVRHRIGLDVLEPVVRVQPELVVRQQRIHADQRVAGGAGVHAEAGQQRLLRGRASAGHRPRVEDHALASRRARGRPPRSGCCGPLRPPRCRRLCSRHGLLSVAVEEPGGVAAEDQLLLLGRQAECPHVLRRAGVAHVERIVRARAARAPRPPST